MESKVLERIIGNTAIPVSGATVSISSCYMFKRMDLFLGKVYRKHNH
jgi:hypothetical protein